MKEFGGVVFKKMQISMKKLCQKEKNENMGKIGSW
jgi:hypothetical protein